LDLISVVKRDQEEEIRHGGWMTRLQMWTRWNRIWYKEKLPHTAHKLIVTSLYIGMGGVAVLHEVKGSKPETEDRVKVINAVLMGVLMLTGGISFLFRNPLPRGYPVSLMKVLHETTSTLDIELETTALYTSFQEIQEPWLLALSLDAKQCHGCEIPSTLPLLKLLHCCYIKQKMRLKSNSLQPQSIMKSCTLTASLHLTALKPGFPSVPNRPP